MKGKEMSKTVTIKRSLLSACRTYVENCKNIRELDGIQASHHMNTVLAELSEILDKPLDQLCDRADCLCKEMEDGQ